jgi:hypothetical protein
MNKDTELCRTIDLIVIQRTTKNKNYGKCSDLFK